MAYRPSGSRKKIEDLPTAETRVCVLYGPEPMRKRLCFEALQAALEAEHGRVQVVPFDAQAATLAQVLDELRSYSLLEPYKLVVVDEADQFIATHRAAMERYVANPVDHATLVLRSGRWNRGKIDQQIKKVGSIHKFDPLPDVQAKAWLVQRAKDHHQRKLDPRAAAMLVERVGSDLMRLDNELGKLAVMVAQDEPISATQIEQAVGRGSDEQAWVVQEAVLASFATNSSGVAGGVAIEKIHELVDRAGQADVLVTYFVADLIRKLYHGLMMKRQGGSEQQIADRLKLWGARRGLFMGVLGRLDERSAGHGFDQVIRCDVRAKSGLGQAVRNLECFCAAFADEVT